MNKGEASKIAKGYFKNYPSVNEFHVTSDGQVFEGKENANAHAASLDKKNPEVNTVGRNDVDEPAESPELTAAKKELKIAKQELTNATKALGKAKPANKAAAQEALEIAEKKVTDATSVVTGLTA